MILIYEKHPPFAFLYMKSFAFIREFFAAIRKSFAFIRESFASIRAFIRERFALILEKNNFSPT